MGVSPGLRRRPLILGTSVFSLESGRSCVCALSLSLVKARVKAALRRGCGLVSCAASVSLGGLIDKVPRSTFLLRGIDDS